MITTLILIGMIITGIILLNVSDSEKFELSWKAEEMITFISIALITIGIILLAIFGMMAGCNAVSYDLDYQNFLHEKEMLEYRIEHMEDNITGNEMLYNDIVEFNNELRREKKWANNPWTNWFYNKNIASLDYIELD